MYIGLKLKRLFFIFSDDPVKPHYYSEGNWLFVFDYKSHNATLYEAKRNQWIRKGYLHAKAWREYTGLSATTNALFVHEEIELTDDMLQEIKTALQSTPRPLRLYVMPCIPLNLSHFIAGDHVLVTTGQSKNAASLIEIVRNKPPMEGLRVKCMARFSKEEESPWTLNEKIQTLMEQPAAITPNITPYFIEADERIEMLNTLMSIAEPNVGQQYPRFSLAAPSTNNQNEVVRSATSDTSFGIG